MCAVVAESGRLSLVTKRITLVAARANKVLAEVLFFRQLHPQLRPLLCCQFGHSFRSPIATAPSIAIAVRITAAMMSNANRSALTASPHPRGALLGARGRRAR